MAAPVGPASLLDAAHGDGHGGAGGDEHGHIEDAVLLGADQLLAVEEEQRLVGRVGDLEIRHRPRLAHLRDADALAGLAEREPGGLGEERGEDGDHGERAVGDGLAGQDIVERLRDGVDLGERGHGVRLHGVEATAPL